ncbi:biotin-dependent carboxyltransferase family protein [Nocardioides sp. SYSU DS0663]|uniref:5-oxoprolinase subunit C family protein n=1 Tax=Nocardioides sp. SYSU DS0663 TaxID=3416445 RepID=UPI003F4B0CC4
MTLTVLRAGHLTTVQDEGRPGHAHLGVPRAGALDQPAYALANRLVGNPPGAAVLESTLGGLVVRADVGRWVAVTGADRPHPRAEWLAAGTTLEVGTPRRGVRSYLAVAGGVAVEPVLGSRSTDTLAWVGPPRVADGAVLPVGEPAGPPAAHDTPRPGAAGPLRLHPGPRLDWFAGDALERLCVAAYRVADASNRIGLRLDGPVVERVRPGELASEGMVLGAVQVPPSGQPVVFLADHPPTGGYPVVAVVEPADLWRCAQLRPGDAVCFTAATRERGVAARR